MGKEEHAQTSTTAMIGIIIIVAVAFAGIGYSIVPDSTNREEVMDYIQKAPENEVEEIITVVPDKIINEKAQRIFPLIVNDDLDRRVVVPEKPDKIISLAPSMTETLFALGLENKVIGVTEFCDYPPQVPKLVEDGKIEIVGGYSTVDTEKVVGLEPDLVVTAAGTSKDTINQLEKVGIPVVGVEGENIMDVLSDIKLIGRITGTLETAKELTDNMEEKMNSIVEKTNDIPSEEKPKVFYEVGTDPIYTVGPGTFIQEIIKLSGGVNAAENIKRKYSSMTAEDVIKMDPEVFVIAVHGSELPLSTVDSIKDRFKGIDAVKNDRIYKLSSQEINMFHRAGPRLIKALERMTEILHPGLDVNS